MNIQKEQTAFQLLSLLCLTNKKFSIEEILIHQKTLLKKTKETFPTKNFFFAIKKFFPEKTTFPLKNKGKLALTKTATKKNNSTKFLQKKTKKNFP